MAGLNLRWPSGASSKATGPAAEARSGALSASLALLLAVTAIVLLAFSARIYNVDWDDGTHAHPDERHMTLVTVGLHLPGSIGEYFDTEESRLNAYNLPNSPSFVYGTFPVFLTKVAAVVFGQDNYDDLVLTGRRLAAVFSAATVLFAFLAGRRLYGPAAGLIAAALIASAPLAIQHAHFFVVDTYLVFFMAAAFYFAVRVMQEGRPSDYALTGLMLGLGMACKVTGALFLPVLLAAAAVRLWPLVQPESGQKASPSPHAGRPELVEGEKGLGGEDSAATWQRPLLGVLLALLVALLAFRVAQPYAFDGLVSLNERWVDDQREQERLLGGEVGFPPSLQWIDRSSYLYPLQDMVLWGMGPAFGIAAWAAFAYAGYRLLRYRELVHLLPLLFVLVYFGFMGRQFSLYMRYFLPLYPVLAILAGYAVVQLYRNAGLLAQRFRRPWLEHAGIAVATAVLAGAVIAGLAYTSIYGRGFTRVEATHWLYANVPEGAVVAGEMWDETLPMGIRNPPGKHFRIIGLNLYDPDTSEKLAGLVNDLDRADYVAVNSNRLINSLPRNPINYPVASRYHELLFSGALGFELAAEFTSYPRVLGIEFADHRVQESWSSYDHPRVLIFRKAPDYSRERLEQLLGAGPYAEITVPPKAAEGVDLLLTPSELSTQREGGTWTDVFSDGGLAGNYPTLVWLVALQAAAFAVTPIALSLFRRLPDRGYLLAKPLGLLLLGYLTWLTVSLKLVHFEQGSILALLLILAAAGGLLWYRARTDLNAFLRENWRLVLFSEALFLGAFLLFWLLRLENPDLWHPFRGGEKPMDLAYLTAVTRSTTLPPYDPWFAGGYINYYYLGQFFTATLSKLTTIPPEVTFNLAVPTFFALTVAGAFSVAYNLAAAYRAHLTPQPPLRFRRGGVPPDADGGRVGDVNGDPAGPGGRISTVNDDPTSGEAAGAAAPPLRFRRGGWGVRYSPYVAGILGAFFVAIAGNLDGVGQLVERLSEVSSFQLGSGLPVLDSVVNSAGGLWQVAFHGADLRDFDYWRSSRMMPPTISITEFPFFSFLFADLHAHMMAIAFQVLTVGICLALVLRTKGDRDVRGDLALVVLLGLVVGSLRWLNSWDYPPFLLLALAAVLISERHLEGGVWPSLRRALLKGGLLVALSFLFFQPFLANYRTPVAGVTSSPEQTPIHQYLAHFGLFAAVIAVALAVWTYQALQSLRRPGDATRQATFEVLAGAAVAVVALSLFLIALGQPLVAVLLPVFAVVVALAVREVINPVAGGGIRLFVLSMLALGLGLSMGVDIIILEGDIVRMNTVFKFYLHVWVLFALVAAFLVWQLLAVYAPRLSSPDRAETARPLRLLARGLTAGFVLLLAGVTLYPLFATPARLDDRFEGSSSTGLDGAAYGETATYNDPHGPIVLADDFEGIDWLRQNVEGTPTIAEGRADLYRWGGRFSIYTGLPAVLGWDWHQTQQRGDLAHMVARRVIDLDSFYNTRDAQSALRFLDTYDVRYVMVGQLERYYYHPDGLAKLDAGLDGALKPVFQNATLTIYEVVPDRLAAALGR